MNDGPLGFDNLGYCGSEFAEIRLSETVFDFVPVTTEIDFVPVTTENDFVPVATENGFVPVTTENDFVPGTTDCKNCLALIALAHSYSIFSLHFSIYFKGN